MSGHKVTYTLDGKQYSRVFDYSSTEQEACKMAELSARWKDLNCNFQVISVEDVKPNYSLDDTAEIKHNSKNCFLFKYDGRDGCK